MTTQWTWLTRVERNRLAVLAWERDTGRVSEWPGGIEGVDFKECEHKGITYVSVTLRGCVSAFGLTRDQALRNLDVAARGYIERLARTPGGPHRAWQIATMQRYLHAREAQMPCPCDVVTCECVADERIAH